jgi:hypothetical protein
MGVKVKYQGQWLDEYEAAERRTQDQQAEPTPPPAVDVDALPEPGSLDPDVPLAQLFHEHPQVRPYITADGQVRSGLKPSDQVTAQAILTRYGV